MQVIPKASVCFFGTVKHVWLLNVESHITDLSEFRVTQLVRPQPAEGPVQLEQLKGMAA